MSLKPSYYISEEGLEELTDIDPKTSRDRLIKILVTCNIIIFSGPCIYFNLTIDFNLISRVAFSLLYIACMLLVIASIVALIFLFIRPLTGFIHNYEEKEGQLEQEDFEKHWNELTGQPARLAAAVTASVTIIFSALSFFLENFGVIDLHLELVGYSMALFQGLVLGMASYGLTRSALKSTLDLIYERHPLPWGGYKLNPTRKLLIAVTGIIILPLLIMSIEVDRWNIKTAKESYSDLISADLEEKAEFLGNNWSPSEPLPAFIKNSDKYFISAPGEKAEITSESTPGHNVVETREYLLAPIGYGLELGRYTNADEWKPYTRKLRTVVMIFFVLISVMALLGAYIFGKMTSKSTHNMIDLTRQMARDQAFRYKYFISYSDDEADALTIELNNLVSVIQKQFGSTESLLDHIREAVQVLGSSTAEMRAVADRQAEGAQAQAGRVSDLAGTSTEIATTASQITLKTASVKIAAEDTLNACIEGVKRIVKAVDQISSANKHADQMVERMMKLETQFQKIEKAVENIAEVSDRTELLSLNAALEAAGARKFGKRFGVVATEIKRLSGTIGQMTMEIFGHIASLRKAIADTGDATRDSAKIIEGGVDGVIQVKDDLDKLSKIAENAFAATIEINLSTREQTLATEKLAETLQEIADLANNVAIGSEESKKAIEEINQLAINFNNMIWSTDS